VRIDRSYLADEPGEDQRVRPARVALDGEDTAGKGECKTAPNRDNPAEAATAEKPVNVAAPDRAAETRTRGEVYADTRQCCESGWERQRLFEAPRDELVRFRVDRAGLPQISPEDTDRYIEEHRSARPGV
jgi:hypothetical protein